MMYRFIFVDFWITLVTMGNKARLLLLLFLFTGTFIRNVFFFFYYNDLLLRTVH